MRAVGRELLREGSSRVLSAVAAAGRGRRGAGMFSGRVNAVTGRQEWVAEQRDAESEEGDLSPELARSQYGDMLHDTARNQLYCQALEKAVADMKGKGRTPHVLDIGTGTGLLSMMAARAGASRVTAVEVMKPMVRIAREVIAANGYSDVVTVVPKRSTDMTEADMEGGRANILVTEVFDTELIGEGALLTYSHALHNLMEPDSIVIPDSVTVYVQLVASEFLWHHHKLVPERLPVRVSVPTDWRKCPGAPSLWDLHAEQLQSPQQLSILSDTTQIAKFTLSDPDLSSHSSAPPVVVPVTDSGTCHGVLMWWSADMSGTELTMSPWQYTQWRDHWMQAVQLLPEPLNVSKGDKLTVTLGHDDYSMWFHVSPLSSSSSLPASLATNVQRPLCVCGVHTAWSRLRIAMHNDTTRTQLYLNALTQVLSGKSRVVCVSDGSLLPLLLAKSNIPTLSTVYVLENSEHSSRLYKRLLEANPPPSGKNIRILTKSAHDITTNDLVCEATPPEGALIGAVIGEPYFSTSLLPWHNLHFWYARDALRGVCSPDCLVFPASASLMAIAVCFEDLYSLRAPVGNVEGFDISAFDREVGKVNSDDEWVEPEVHSLWEYPAYPRSDVHTLMNFDLSSPVPSSPIRVGGAMELTHPPITEGESGSSVGGGRCNGMVLWMDYQLTDHHITTTGLVKPPRELNERLYWDTNSKQAVHFLSPDYVQGTHDSHQLNYDIEFNTASGELRFQFTAS